eukprot:scaffold2889_cov407-Prasinococcus_capsulatus_cf.AAC.4
MSSARSADARGRALPGRAVGGLARASQAERAPPNPRRPRRCTIVVLPSVKGEEQEGELLDAGGGVRFAGRIITARPRSCK